MKRITKRDAAKALWAGAYGHSKGASVADTPRRIHCRGEFTGAHWNLDDALHVVAKAQDVGWVDGALEHDLCVIAQSGTTWFFDVASPDRQEVGQ